MMMRCSAFALALLLLLTHAVTAATSAVNPVADAFVTPGPSANLSGNNYGGAGSLAVAASGSSKGEFQSVLQFDLATVKSDFDSQYGVGQWSPQSVTLQLTSGTPNNSIFNPTAAGSFSITLMNSNTWSEGTGTPNAPTTDGITWNTLPSFISGSDPSLGAFSFDGNISTFAYNLAMPTRLMSDISTGGTASFRLAADDGTISYFFNSRSFNTSTARPLLSVSAVPEPSSATLLGIGGLLLLRRRRRLWI